MNCAAEWDARLATNPDRPVASAQALAAPQQAILLDKLVPAGWAPAAREGEVGSRTVGDVLLTPLGPFALTTSGTIEEDWLEEMTDLAKRHWGDYVHI